MHQMQQSRQHGPHLQLATVTQTSFGTHMNKRDDQNWRIMSDFTA